MSGPTHDATQVIQEIMGGDALGLGAAARKVPAHRGEGQANPSTIWRWINMGAKARDGRTVRLESARIGGRWMTSAAALARFFAALTPVDGQNPAAPACAPSARRRSAEGADRRLTTSGW